MKRVETQERFEQRQKKQIQHLVQLVSGQTELQQTDSVEFEAEGYQKHQMDSKVAASWFCLYSEATSQSFEVVVGVACSSFAFEQKDLMEQPKHEYQMQHHWIGLEDPKQHQISLGPRRQTMFGNWTLLVQYWRKSQGEVSLVFVSICWKSSLLVCCW